MYPKTAGKPSMYMIAFVRLVRTTVIMFQFVLWTAPSPGVTHV